MFYIGQVNDDCLPDGNGCEIKMDKDGVERCYFEGSFKDGKRNGSGKEFAENCMNYEVCMWKDGIKDTALPSEAIPLYQRLTGTTQIPQDLSYRHYGKIDPSLSKSLTLFKGFVNSKGEKVIGQKYSEDNLNRLIYEGHFKDDKYHEKGRLLITYRYSFEGMFNCGQMISGVLCVDTIPIYEGEVNSRGEMNGKGKLFYLGNKRDEKRSVMVEGVFRNNKVQGFARVFYKSGQLKCCGFFVDGQIHGKGLVFGEDGSFVIGYDGETMGPKVEILKNSSDEEVINSLNSQNGIIECWKNGKLEGEVPIITNRGCYHVYFEKNKPTFIRNNVIDHQWMCSGNICTTTKNDSGFIDLGIVKVVMEGEVTVYLNNEKYADCVFKDGIQNGPCRIYRNNSVFYDGEAYNLIPQGNGKRMVNQSILMDGFFEKGVLKKGMVWIQTQTQVYQFTGELEPGISYEMNSVDKVTGRGKLLCVGSNVVYDGDIKENLCEGQGILKQIQNEQEFVVYEGFWKGNKYNGEGRLYHKNCVYEGQFEEGMFKGGRTLDYSIKKNGYDCEVTEIVTISTNERPMNFSLVYELNETKNQRLYVKFVTVKGDSESGLYYDSPWIRQSSSINARFFGSCNWYSCPPEQLDQVFSSQNLTTEERIKRLHLRKRVMYTEGRPSGTEEYYRDDGSVVYYDDNTKNGRIMLKDTVIYEGDLLKMKSGDIVANGSGEGICYEGSYKGQWKNGMRSGKGVLICKDGRIFEGEWKDDQLDGMVTIKYDGKQEKKKYRRGKDTGYKEYETDKEIYVLELNEREVEVLNVRSKRTHRIKYDGEVITMEKAIKELTGLSKKSWWDRAPYKKYDGYVLNWLKNGARKIEATKDMASMSLPYHVNTYIPHGMGKKYDKNGKLDYEGDFRYGLRDGIGKEMMNGICIYDGEWKYNEYDGEGRVRVNNANVYADCVYQGGVKTEQSALYQNGVLVFKGSFDREWRPTKGIFYIPIADMVLSLDTKKFKLSPQMNVDLNEGSVSYKGQVKLDTTDLLILFGPGRLTVGTTVFDGQFRNNRDIDSCKVYEKQTLVFEGSIRNYHYDLGIRYCPSGVTEEGFFKNDKLIDGYRWSKDGNPEAVNGARQYEAYNKKNHGKYRCPPLDQMSKSEYSMMAATNTMVDTPNLSAGVAGGESRPSRIPEGSAVFPNIHASPSNFLSQSLNELDMKRESHFSSNQRQQNMWSDRSAMNDEPVQVSGSVPLSASQGFNNKNGNGLNNDFSSYRARENRANSDPSQISGLTKLSASQVASPTIRGTRPPQLPNRNVANRVNGVQTQSSESMSRTFSQKTSYSSGTTTNHYQQGTVQNNFRVMDVQNNPLPPTESKPKGNEKPSGSALDQLSRSQQTKTETQVEDNYKGDDTYYVRDNAICMSGSQEPVENAFRENEYIYVLIEGIPDTYRKYTNRNGRYYYLETVIRK